MKSKILCGYFVGVRAAFMELRFLVLIGRQIDPRSHRTCGALPCGGGVTGLTMPMFLLPQILSLSLSLFAWDTHSFLALFCSVFSSGNVDGAVLSAPESWALV